MRPSGPTSPISPSDNPELKRRTLTEAGLLDPSIVLLAALIVNLRGPRDSGRVRVFFEGPREESSFTPGAAQRVELEVSFQHSFLTSRFGFVSCLVPLEGAAAPTTRLNERATSSHISCPGNRGGVWTRCVLRVLCTGAALEVAQQLGSAGNSLATP